MIDWLAQLIAGLPFWAGVSAIVLLWALYYSWELFPMLNPKKEWWQDKAQRLTEQNGKKNKIIKTKKG